MTEKIEQALDGVASELNAELDTGDEVNLLLVSALRQYQHNDCSGLLIGYDYSETQKVVTEIYLQLEKLRATIKHEADYCYHWMGESLLKGDVERAQRHKERGDRLMASI